MRNGRVAIKKKIHSLRLKEKGAKEGRQRHVAFIV